MTDYDVIVVGAGAAGLFCALTAAQRGRRVLVLEKSNKAGKKILMSGGGRCNFTNYFVEASHFICSNPHFCKAALKRFTQWDFIAMVEKHGIAYEERKHGQLFCLGSAKEILVMLLSECEEAGVTIKTHCEITRVKSLQGKPGQQEDGQENKQGTSRRYELELQQGKSEIKTKSSIACESLVVASGALSIPTLGGSGMGYDIATQFSLSLKERRAGLVPFVFSDEMKTLCEALAGVSLEVEVSCHKQSFTESLLFTHRGISGPVILQISNYWSPGDEISVNLLPEVDAQAWLIEAKQQQPKIRLHTLLNQKLGKSLVKALQGLWWPGSLDVPLAEFSDKLLVSVAQNLNGWRLKPAGTEGYRTAEVTLGGVDTDEVSSKTMEAKQQAGLYFIGEVLDVSGHLGGFNFQWAWSSGYSAGLSV